VRQVDRPDDQPGLPPPIRKPAPEPEPDAWTAIASRPGYERNQRGDVRKKPPESIYHFYGVPCP
jgi:hypothetical protein